ncbi:hypothetical protein ABBQ32_005093 [Trebouxia sp. C0010 RCD-2024]
MEACVRHLRAHKENPTSSASFLLIQDTLQTLGQQAVCCEVIRHLQLSAARNQAPTQILVLAFDQPPACYCTSGSHHVHVLDLFSDPFGWVGSLTGSPQLLAWRTGGGLQAVQLALEAHLQALAEQAKDGRLLCHMVLDSLECLLEHAKLQEVLHFLEDMRRHACILSICAGLHQDLHQPQVLAALTSLCTASLQLKPVEGLLKEVAAQKRGKQGGPHGQLQLSLKRHTGRVRVEAELYSLHQNGSLQTFAVPQEAITAQLLAAHAVQNAVSSQQKGASTQAQQVEAEEEARLALLTQQAGIKLTLTHQVPAALLTLPSIQYLHPDLPKHFTITS